MDGFEHCTLARRGAVLTVTLDRPEVLNALHPAAHFELQRAFDLYAADPGLHVAIITGRGDRAFCVGTDLKELARTGDHRKPPGGFAGITTRTDLYKPVIAAVNGLCLGGGAEIVAACDLAVASDRAVFGLPEPRVGLAALGGGALQRLARDLPLKDAMRLILTGSNISAQEALRISLVNEVVPHEQLMEAAFALADEILACAPLAVQASKQVMLQSLDQPDLASAMAATYEAAERMLASEDAVEGPRAFAEKRPPRWSGR
ncbi:enoyl-CoA hydratase-related protein [Ramlibacter sp. MAHUQ-53]|uniref:enoyl-CoA hydratase-related protein n=1 Tax=unclassified Ramlibacter TaxID=2617605 RepID=UPI00363324B2